MEEMTEDAMREQAMALCDNHKASIPKGVGLDIATVEKALGQLIGMDGASQNTAEEIGLKLRRQIQLIRQHRTAHPQTT